MKPTMVPMMQAALALGEQNGGGSLRSRRGGERGGRRNALVAAATPPRSLASILTGDAPKETEASVRRRMVDLVTRMVSGTNSICRDDLLLQFDEDQIKAHFRPALKIAGAHRMAVTW